MKLTKKALEANFELLEIYLNYGNIEFKKEYLEGSFIYNVKFEDLFKLTYILPFFTTDTNDHNWPDECWFLDEELVLVINTNLISQEERNKLKPFMLSYENTITLENET